MTIDRELFGDRLPHHLTRFVGRRRELAELREVAATNVTVTICGVGGLGKTRLAIELVRSLRREADFHEVYWVPLLAVTNDEEVAGAMAAGMGLSIPSGPQTVLALANELRGRRCLVLLDNCEHVAAGCARLVAALRDSRLDLQIVATSRVPIGAVGERVYAVPPMGEDALELFVDRAGLAAPGYALTQFNVAPIGQICRHLAGSPLAVELAATWIGVLSPLDLASRLVEATRAASATSGVDERHQNLQAVIASSWAWLGPAEREVATALGVFRGGFTCEAAEVVAGASLATLAALSDRAIIQRLPDPTGGTRYQMHELIRVHAASQLNAGDAAWADGVRSRHFDYFLRLADAAGAAGRTWVDPALDGPIALERANLDAAFSWAVERADAQRALRILDALDAFWPYSVPLTTERMAHLSRTLDLPWDVANRATRMARAKALNRLGYIVVDTDSDQALAIFADVCQLLDGFDDPLELAIRANALRGFCHCRSASGRLAEARAYAEKSLALSEAVGDGPGEAWTRFQLAILCGLEGSVERARTEFADNYRHFESLGMPFGMYRNRFRLADLLRTAGDRASALDAYQSSFDLADAYGLTCEGGDLLEGLGLLAASLHDHEKAARLIGASATWRAVHDERSHLYWPSGQADLERGRRALGTTSWEAQKLAGSQLTPAAAAALAREVIADLRVVLLEQSAHLTDRELDVLRLVAEGLNNDAIAARFALSPRTVHAHLRSIFTKLGVTNRTAAVHEAVLRHLA